MITKLGNIADNSNSVNSLASTFEDEALAVASQLESEHAETGKNSNSTEHRECESQFNDSSQPQEASTANVETKGNLADWGVVACVFLSNLITALDFTGFGVFYPHLVERFEATTAAVGWCSSICGFCQAVVALFASYPIQSYGCRLPGVIGCLLFSLGMSLSFFAPNLTTIYFTYGIIAGSGKGLATLSSSIIIHQKFSRNKNRNLASGIGWLGSSFGGIIGAIITNQLIQVYSWRGAFLVLAAIQAQRIPLFMFFRTPKRLTSHSKHAPGTNPRKISCQIILRYLKETFNFSILRHARYSTFVIANFLHVFCMMGYGYHTVNRAIKVGLSPEQGVAAVTLYSSMSMTTRFFIPFIANLPKVKSSLVFAAGMFCSFLSIVAIFINSGFIGTMTSAVLFGIYLGCTTTVFTIVAVDLMGVALLPKSLAILQFIGGFARLVSPPLIGWVFDVTGVYNKAFAIIGCLAFVSGSLMVGLTFVTRCHRRSVSKDVEGPPSNKSLPNPTTTAEGET